MPRENVDNQVQNLLKKALPLIDSSKDRETFTELVKEYTRNYNVRLLVEGLNNIINCPVRFDLYDDVRSVILPQQQMEYNLRTPYVTHRPRVVRLSRKEGTSFGFAVRGGKEHGTGIYVSAVEPDSEADRQGLRVGDQLLRINGLSVEKAIHREVSSIIKSRATLALKVKSAGMIPIRDKKSDHLSWRIVDSESQGPFPVTPKQSKDSSVIEAKLVIHLLGTDSVGCSVIKGPPDRPGIFVQSSREGGPAYAAGIRPGDEVMSLNGKVLSNMDFDEVNKELKSSRHLTLVIRKGVACDLVFADFCGSDSGRGSGDGTTPSPVINERKRLSFVSEEEVLSESTNPVLRRSVSVDRNIDWVAVEEEWESAEELEFMGVHSPQYLGTRSLCKTNSSSSSNFDVQIEIEKIRLEEEKRRLKIEKSIIEEEKRLLKEEKRNLELLKRSLSQGSVLDIFDDREEHGCINKETNMKQETDKITNKIPKEQHQKLLEEFRHVREKMFCNDNNPPKSQVLEKEVFIVTKQELDVIVPKQVQFQESVPAERPIQIEKEVVLRTLSAPPVPPPLPTDRPLRRVSAPTRIYLSKPTTSSPDLVDPFATPEKMPPPPQPPSTYFDSFKKSKSTVQISFGEYPNPGQLPPPTKLEFLPPKEMSEFKSGEAHTQNMLKEELSETLSRSKLKQRMSAYMISGEDGPDTTADKNKRSVNGTHKEAAEPKAQSECKTTSSNYIANQNGSQPYNQKMSINKTAKIAEKTVSTSSLEQQNGAQQQGQLIQEVLQKFKKNEGRLLSRTGELKVSKLKNDDNKNSNLKPKSGADENVSLKQNGIEATTSALRSSRGIEKGSENTVKNRPELKDLVPKVDISNFKIQTYDSSSTPHVKELAGKFENGVLKKSGEKVTIIIKK
ncbi:harmonin-like isoform X2 [Artemia franciscana]